LNGLADRGDAMAAWKRGGDPDRDCDGDDQHREDDQDRSPGRRRAPPFEARDLLVSASYSLLCQIAKRLVVADLKGSDGRADRKLQQVDRKRDEEEPAVVE